MCVCVCKCVRACTSGLMTMPFGSGTVASGGGGFAVSFSGDIVRTGTAAVYVLGIISRKFFQNRYGKSFRLFDFMW